jgi:ribosome biogenesis GTPase
MNLIKLGWNKKTEAAFKEAQKLGYKAGRVFAEYKNFYKVQYEEGEVLAELSGKLLHEALQQEDLPAVGDWVAISPRHSEGRGTIHQVLPRSSKFSRKVAGIHTREQIVAANMDRVFIVNSVNNDFNLRRMERYLLLTWESGANPVILLSKADLCENVEEMIEEAQTVAIGVPIHAVSTHSGLGMESLKQYFSEGQTVALLGSSGVGKSSLINYLVGGAVQKVQELRHDGQKGKHTSTHREMFVLPEGGLMIDTPGMREIQLWDAAEGLQEAFEDVEDIAAQCFFKDCKHGREPGCALREAIRDGTLSIDRLDSYKKLEKELRFLERKQATANRLTQRKTKQGVKRGCDKGSKDEIY